MSAIGLRLPYDTLGSRDVIVPELREAVASEVGKVVSRFAELSPAGSPGRMRGRIWRVGPKASYTLPEEPDYEMTAWLLNHSTYLSRRERAKYDLPPDHTVLAQQTLCTNVKGTVGSLRNVKGEPDSRIERVENKIYVMKSHFSRYDIQGIEPTSALSVLTRVNDTLDLIEAASN